MADVNNCGQKLLEQKLVPVLGVGLLLLTANLQNREIMIGFFIFILLYEKATEAPYIRQIQTRFKGVAFVPECFD